MISKLALGTVQLGMSYGVSNELGQPSPTEAKKIIDTAKMNGIRLLDTAMTYGSSETVLGKCDVSSFQVVTKIPPLDQINNFSASRLIEYFEKSLKRLGVKSIYALMMHRDTDLFNKNAYVVYEVIKKLKREKKINKFGISIYNTDSLAVLMEKFKIDLIQAPVNVIDRRLENSGWLNRLKQANVEIHTRSAFLQGLLLLPLDRIPRYFDKWMPLFKQWHQFLYDNDVTALDACLSYPLSLGNVKNVIVGVQTRQELNQILEVEMKKFNIDTSFMSCEEQGLINPAYW